MRIVGQILELDPEKKYVMLVEAGQMSENDIKLLTDALVAQKDSMFTIALPNGFETIRFVENSDRIVDVVAKENINSKEGKA